MITPSDNEAVLSFVKELFAYNRHCNQAVIDAMIEHESSLSQHSLILFSHILNAHYIWNCRINGSEPPGATWDIRALNDFRKDDNTNYRESLLITDNCHPETAITYTTKKGGVFTNTVLEILFQVINHSTYHRAQLATEFRRTGIEPLMTDYIFYKMKMQNSKHKN